MEIKFGQPGDQKLDPKLEENLLTEQDGWAEANQNIHFKMRKFETCLFAVWLLSCFPPSSPSARAASETPPAGPPWTKDFLEAHRIAFEQGKPIFVYSTKTH